MSVDHGAPPVIPSALLPYDSYTIDPAWQLHFTAMWGAALGFVVLLAAPRALRLRNLRLLSKNLLGVRVRGEYEPLPTREPDAPSESRIPKKPTGSTVLTAGRLLDSVRLWSLPGLPLNLGQIVVIVVYSVFALVCIVVQAPLMENPNRAGFLALAQLPPVFLFASKNSPLTGLLLGPGVDYTKLNYIHRWSARFLFLGAMVHGTLWINNHVVYNLPILSQQKEGSGVAALATLCVLVLTSFAPVRRRCYSLFLVVHFLTFPAFFVTICYHTIYAPPWIFPPVAFYAADVFVRIIRWRVVVGRVEAKEGGMSLIHIPIARTGWRAGQHVQMRALIGARAWEAHPLSVCCAEPSVSCLTAPDGSPIGMLLAARACGDWSRSLWAYAKDAPEEEEADSDEADPDVDLEAGEIKAEKRVVASKELEPTDPGRDAHLLLEGPYGGPALRAGDFERVLLFAGGSGATFTLAVLDELVGRCVRLGRREGEKTRRVVWCWCVRSFGAINWFAPHLLQIATLAARPEAHLDLRIRIFVTCLCDPDAVPAIPGCTVTEARPIVGRVLDRLLDDVARQGVDCCGQLGPIRGKDEKGVDEKRTSTNSSASASTVDLEAGEVEEDDQEKSGTGGVAVFAAGPARLIREAGNAVASANLSARGRKAGGVSFNAEVFTI
ncbi:iron reductase [Mycena sanguinolenta]|nr:iron reductase [Mycena sanguinolenta]